MNLGKALATAASAGLLLSTLQGCGGSAPAAEDPAGAAAEGKACCKGQNECKGKGGCKTDANECAGKNECGGKGGCNAHCPK